MISIVPKKSTKNLQSISISSKRRRSTKILEQQTNGIHLVDDENDLKHSTNGIYLNGQFDSSYDIEIGWFMKEEFPKVCTTLRGLLKDVTDFIMNSSILKERDDGKLFEDSRLVNFKSSNELLYGLLVMEGWNINEAEININFN